MKAKRPSLKKVFFWKALVSILHPASVLLLLFSVLVVCSCKKDDPDPPDDPIELEGTWDTMASMDTARVGLATAVVDGKIYAIGGRAKDTFALKTVEMYDPETNTWTPKADMHQAGMLLTANTVNDTIYAIGGGNGDELRTKVEAYDPVTDKWEEKSLVPSPRKFAASCVVGDTIYIIGGGPEFFAPGNRVDAYNTKTDTWEQKASLPEKWSAMNACTINGKIIAFGGANKLLDYSPVYEYNVQADEWTKISEMDLVRAGIASGEIDGIIYTTGGGSSIILPALPLVQAYDPVAGGLWWKLKNMPTPRLFHACSVVDDQLYAIGGESQSGDAGTVYKKVERLTLDED